MLTLRMARPEDAEALVAIYREYIPTPVTFEYTCPTPGEFSGRIEKTLAAYPWLVCEEDGRPVGYAYASPRGERAAYGWSAALSVYLTASCTGRNLGARLYGALLELLTLQNVFTAFAAVTGANPPSHRFHLSQGFTASGAWHNCGYKNGRWYDVVHYEKQLAPLPQTPAPFVPLPRLEAAAVRAVLEKWSRTPA